MNLYELTYLIKPDLTNEEAKEYNKKLTGELKEEDATLYKMEEPKKRNLAYDLKGFKEAYIACVDMDIDPQRVKIIEEKMKRDDNILRHLIISKEELEEEEDPEKEKDVKEEEDDESNEKEEKDESEEDKEDEDKKEDKKEDKVKLNEIDEKIDEIL